jgi:hypothetical protein
MACHELTKANANNAGDASPSAPWEQLSNNMKTLNMKKIKTLPLKLSAGIVLGGIAGYLFYYFVGCQTGTCPITSNPYWSILYGTVMGALMARV